MSWVYLLIRSGNQKYESVLPPKVLRFAGCVTNILAIMKGFSLSCDLSPLTILFWFLRKSIDFGWHFMFLEKEGVMAYMVLIDHLKTVFV